MNKRKSLLPQKTALVVIDVQKGFDAPQWGRRNNPQAEDNIARLLEAWRRTNRPVIHIQHMSRNPASPLRPGQEGNELKDLVRPQGREPVVRKCVNSSFIGTGLEARLRRGGIKTLVMTGINTNHCVSTTARMAGNLGFEGYVVADGTATFDRRGHDGRLHKAKDMHDIGLAELHGEFATVLETDEVLELL
jgi:nicotinamidase-related amidase